MKSRPPSPVFERMLKERERRGKLADTAENGAWNMGMTGADVFHWWMEDGTLPGQIMLEEYENHQ